MKAKQEQMCDMKHSEVCNCVKSSTVWTNIASEEEEKKYCTACRKRSTGAQ